MKVSLAKVSGKWFLIDHTGSEFQVFELTNDGLTWWYSFPDTSISLETIIEYLQYQLSGGCEYDYDEMF